MYVCLIAYLLVSFSLVERGEGREGGGGGGGGGGRGGVASDYARERGWGRGLRARLPERRDGKGRRGQLVSDANTCCGRLNKRKVSDAV